jgi:hypothetical protein
MLNEPMHIALGSNAGITTPGIRTDDRAFFDLLENTRLQLLSFNL